MQPEFADALDLAARSSAGLVLADRHEPYRTLFGAPWREPRRERVPKSQAGWPKLSQREREVARQFVQGRRPAEIAAQLGLSVHTVRSHLRFMYRELGVDSQIEFAARLLEHPPRPE